MKVRIETNKDTLKKALLSFGEFDLAEKVDNLTEEQIKTVGEIAAKYIGQHKLVDKTIVCGAIEYLEGKSRPPKKNRRDLSYYKDTAASVDNEASKTNWWTRLFRRSKN